MVYNVLQGVVMPISTVLRAVTGDVTPYTSDVVVDYNAVWHLVGRKLGDLTSSDLGTVLEELMDVSTQRYRTGLQL